MSRDSQLQILKRTIDAIHPVPEPEWDAFSRIWQPFSAKRKQVVTHTGERERYLYFVIEGVQRVFYYDEQGREATMVFTYAPSFGGVLDSILLQKESKYFYETLTPSLFLRALTSELHQQMAECPAIQTMVLKGVSHAMSGLLERLVELQSYSSEEKFRSLMERSPHILQLVPHKYLANYMGIDPTNFSKLINKIKL